jgi:hypothetical protein
MSSFDADLVVGAIDPERMEEGGAGPPWRVLDRLEKTAIGTRRAGEAIAVRRSEPAGCVLYGPYWQLPSGTYRLNFRCRSGKPRIPSQPVLGVEVIAMNRVQLAWLDLTAAELSADTGFLEFSVPPALGLGAGDEARLEFRFFHMANADLKISAVGLHTIHKGETRSPSARRWRLLGRLERSAIGKHTRGGVAVRQAERPGCLLYGGRPLLQLPEGHYRLGFRCAIGGVRMPSQPVLGVEIVASRRWQDDRFGSWRPQLDLPTRGGVQLAWADFTAQELSAGVGSVDFAVLSELSLEGGQEVLFGCRLIHLGNADLTVTAVDLQQTAEEEIPPAQPREWRLLGRLVKGAFGARDADCVRVRQGAPKGVLLYGPRSDLQLAEGRYRLSFCCRAGPPRTGTEPVLDLEILARTRWLGTPARNPARSLGKKREGFWRSLLRPRSLRQLRRSFTAEELRAGPVSVEFEVPAELSREGERDVRFEFIFRHLANADLAIDAVNLHEVVATEHRSHNPWRSSAKGKRTNVLIVGNCQAQTVHEAFVRIGELNLRLDAERLARVRQGRIRELRGPAGPEHQ